MLLNSRRGLVPACLTLGALLAAVPTLADTPAAPSVSASMPQLIVLQHLVPGDMVKTQHWDKPAGLPGGVTQIVSVPLRNALLVTGTPAGLSTVQAIVKILDIEPRRVQIKFALASASETDLEASGVTFDLVPLSNSGLKQGFLQYASGPAVARYLQTLQSQQAVTEEPDMMGANNVEASVALSVTEPAVSQKIRVTPRVNADDSVTLDLHAAFSDGAGKREVNTLRTVPSGGTFVIALPPTASSNDGYLLLFVTPTIK